jgi:hypothetical protein
MKSNEIKSNQIKSNPCENVLAEEHYCGGSGLVWSELGSVK